MPETPAISYHNLIEACARPGCPLCTLADQSAEKYLNALMYELVNDPDARDQLRHTLGFCNRHAHQLLTIRGASLGIGIIYRDVVNAVVEKLETAKYERARGINVIQETVDHTRPAAATAAAVRAISPQAPCPACAQAAKMESIAFRVLLAGLGEAEVQAALRASAGLCLPHLRRALELTRQPAEFDTLVAIAREKLVAFRAELDEFIRKNDYRFRDEGMGPEGDSWKRAISKIVGPLGTKTKDEG